MRAARVLVWLARVAAAQPFIWAAELLPGDPGLWFAEMAIVVGPGCALAEYVGGD